MLNFLKLFFDPRGSIDRKSYLFVHVVFIIVLFLSFMLLDLIERHNTQNVITLANSSSEHCDMVTLSYIAFAFIYLCFIFSMVFAKIKRFHDIGRSGFNVLCFLIPFVNIYFFFLLLFKKGIKSDSNVRQQS